MSTAFWLRKKYSELSSDKACLKWIDNANNTTLRKTTGSIRTQYPIEWMLWCLFDCEMKQHETLEVKQSYFPNRMDEWEMEKTRIYNNMRKIMLTVNQIFNDREVEKTRMAEEEERERQRIDSLSKAAIDVKRLKTKTTRAVKRQERKVENEKKMASGNVRRSSRIR